MCFLIFLFVRKLGYSREAYDLAQGPNCGKLLIVEFESNYI